MGLSSALDAVQSRRERERPDDQADDLSGKNRHALALFCAQQNVEPRDFVRAILEQALDSAATDETLAPVWAAQANAYADRRVL